MSNSCIINQLIQEELPMATITPRQVHGHTYYYWVASKRMDGKPRLVLQKYWGRAEGVVAP